MRGENSDKESHVWLLDGWYRYEAKKCTWVGNAMVSAEPIQDILTHCNFGWKGAWDGYYYPWAFDTALRQGYDKGEIIGDDPALFDTGLKMCVYL